MITLKDYLGGIYKEITNAKVQSDLETLVIAQEYLNDPMLKHFSVPNIRMKNIELNIPVAIDTVNFSPYANVTEIKMNEIYKHAFNSSYETFYKKTTPIEVTEKVIPIINEASKKFVFDFQSIDTNSIDIVNNFVTEQTINFAKNTYSYFEGITSYQEYQKNDLLVVKTDFDALRPVMSDIPVIVETQKLKDINASGNLITIKMNVYNDNMEWTTEANEDGSYTDVLTYE